MEKEKYLKLIKTLEKNFPKIKIIPKNSNNIDTYRIDIIKINFKIKILIVPNCNEWFLTIYNNKNKLFEESYDNFYKNLYEDYLNEISNTIKILSENEIDFNYKIINKKFLWFNLKTKEVEFKVKINNIWKDFYDLF